MIGAGAVLALDWAVPSLLNFYWRSPEPFHWERFLRYIIHLHGEAVGPFTRRPVTTALLHQAYLIFHDAWISFLVVQGVLLAAGAWALNLVAHREDGARPALFSQLLYFASFTVLFSFVTPNDAFDEPAQYLFLFLTLYFLREGRAVGFACALLASCLCRETSLLLVPGFWLLEPPASGHPRTFERLRRYGKYVLPLAAWAAFYIWKDAAGDPGRFQYWAKNFASPKIAYETAISLALALTLPMALYFSRPPSSDKAWPRAFWLSFALNTPIVLFAAYARESRLLALPLIFLWPRAGAAVGHAIASIRRASPLSILGCFSMAGVIWLTYHPVYRHVLGYRIYAAILPILALPFFTGRQARSRAP